jgi:hypothetical protein
MRVGVFIFGSVRFLSKKVTKPIFLKKKTELKPVQTDRFRFGSVRFFREKTGSKRFDSVFRFGSVLAQFFIRFFSVQVRFGSVFSVSGLKNQNRTETVSFFKILIGLISFFHGSVF